MGGLITGDAQATLKSRAFLYKYDNSALAFNKGRYNRGYLNGNFYSVMFKMFSNFNGDVERGFSAQTKLEGKGLFTDESIALLNGVNDFKNNLYTNAFNDNYYFQSYHQFGFTYKEKPNNHFTLGAKLSVLLGIQSEKLNITNFSILFDKPGDKAFLSLKGTFYFNYIPGHLIVRDYLPTFRNPGAAISLGASYRTEDGFIIQGNLKDLGFIHWSGRSYTYRFDNTGTIKGLSEKAREDSVYNGVYKIVHSNTTVGSFNTTIDGKAELSVNRRFSLNYDGTLRYSPILVATKNLFYPGFAGALVNPVQYKSYILAVTTSYDDLKMFTVGLQFMYKTPNYDIYLGSDNLTQTVSILSATLSHPQGTTYSNSSYTAANIFFGFSLKFCQVIEHPMNSSVIPTGEKGFLGRLWGRLFKTND